MTASTPALCAKCGAARTNRAHDPLTHRIDYHEFVPPVAKAPRAEDEGDVRSSDNGCTRCAVDVAHFGRCIYRPTPTPSSETPRCPECGVIAEEGDFGLWYCDNIDCTRLEDIHPTPTAPVAAPSEVPNCLKCSRPSNSRGECNNEWCSAYYANDDVHNDFGPVEGAPQAPTATFSGYHRDQPAEWYELRYVVVVYPKAERFDTQRDVLAAYIQLMKRESSQSPDIAHAHRIHIVRVTECLIEVPNER